MPVPNRADPGIRIRFNGVQVGIHMVSVRILGFLLAAAQAVKRIPKEQAKPYVGLLEKANRIFQTDSHGKKIPQKDLKNIQVRDHFNDGKRKELDQIIWDVLSLDNDDARTLAGYLGDVLDGKKEPNLGSIRTYLVRLSKQARERVPETPGEKLITIAQSLLNNRLAQLVLRKVLGDGQTITLEEARKQYPEHREEFSETAQNISMQELSENNLDLEEKLVEIANKLDNHDIDSVETQRNDVPIYAARVRHSKPIGKKTKPELPHESYPLYSTAMKFLRSQNLRGKYMRARTLIKTLAAAKSNRGHRTKIDIQK